MKTLTSLLAALLLGSAAAAEPFDLAQRIESQCGPAGFREQAGCTVRLPRGVLDLTGSREIINRHGLILEGISAGGLSYVPEGISAAGTTIRVTTPTDKPALRFVGSGFLSVRNLSIYAPTAPVGIQLTGNNATGQSAHFTELRNLLIRGPRVGLHITGENLDDQNDLISVERVSITGVQIGVLQDSGQSVGNHFDTVEVVAAQTAFAIQNGSFNCDNCYIGNHTASDTFIGVHLTRTPNNKFSHHNVRLAGSHFEQAAGRFIVEDAGGQFPITLEGNSYSLQCSTPDCQMLIIDSQSVGPINLIGELFNGNQNRPTPILCHRYELNQIGVTTMPWLGKLRRACTTV